MSLALGKLFQILFKLKNYMILGAYSEWSTGSGVCMTPYGISEQMFCKITYDIVI